MDLKLACNHILAQMCEVIEQIPEDDFRQPSLALNGSTLGQHFRHAIEFFECLNTGALNGKVNYDHRDHDKAIESSRTLAIEVIHRIQTFIRSAELEQDIQLEVSYNPESYEGIVVNSNIAREVIYNIEHVVHHMALVKIGIRDLCPLIELPEDFGVAISTIRYNRTKA